MLKTTSSYDMKKNSALSTPVLLDEGYPLQSSKPVSVQELNQCHSIVKFCSEILSIRLQYDCPNKFNASANSLNSSRFLRTVCNL